MADIIYFPPPKLRAVAVVKQPNREGLQQVALKTKKYAAKLARELLCEANVMPRGRKKKTLKQLLQWHQLTELILFDAIQMSHTTTERMADTVKKLYGTTPDA